MTKSGQPPKSFTTDTRVVRKNRSAGVSPASEPRQLLLGQHDLCRLEAGDTFFLTTTEGTEISQRHQGSPCIFVYSVSPWWIRCLNSSRCWLPATHASGESLLLAPPGSCFGSSVS